MPLKLPTPTRRLLAVLLAALPAMALANAAEIVSLTGKGETRPPNQATWTAARQAQKIDNEHFVRTGDLSAIALMFADKTQLRLAQNSMFQVKAPQGAGATNTIDLKQGRAWSQTKGGPGRVAMQTPSAIAAIQGTDWEMEVDEQGRSRVTVLHGEVRFYNEHGSVTVRSGEQGSAEVGRAPTKQVLQNPAERIQWVSDFRIDAARLRELRGTPTDALARQLQADLRGNDWPEVRANLEHAHAQGIAPAWAYILLSDIAVYAGAFDVAERWLATGYSRHPLDLRIAATQARLMVMQDRADGAAQLLADTLATADVTQRNPDDHLELLLAQGEVARFTGDALLALRAFESATRLNPADPRGWLGWGAVAGERDEISLARARLAQAQAAADAIGRAPAGTATAPLPQESLLAQRAMAEVQANRLQAARTLFDAALAERPDDYVALTGLGLLHLKAGRSQDALDSFLRAGVIEPRYARAVIYSAVAYHQLGQRDIALQTLQRARSLDKLDPLPHQIAALIQGEQRDLNAAIDSAREALRLLPYVRSLNPIANDQRGSANLGAALAAFGLEDWALSYAQQSYSPFAASSHLFLADRYSGRFNKQSELLQGYLTDPTAFGAVGRVQPLIAGPGTHATVAVSGTRSDVVNVLTPRVVANGYANAQFPLAWFAEGSRIEGRKAFEDGADNYTFAVGAQPLHNLGLFAFANSFQVGIQQPSDGGPALPATRTGGHENRLDVGANFKFGALNQGWLKVGGGDLGVQRAGAANARTTERRDVAIDTRDLQWRHSVAWDVALAQRMEVTWGVELARSQSVALSDTANGNPVRVRLVDDERSTDESRQLYVQAVWPLATGWQLDTGLGFGSYEIQPRFTGRIENAGRPPLPTLRTAFAMDRTRWAPRVGMAWTPQPGSTWRAAFQRWNKPASGSTLQPVATAGIAVDDVTVQAGGELERLRVQQEQEWSANTFTSVFADTRRVKNPGFAGQVLGTRVATNDLDRLRQRASLAFGTSPEVWEDTPVFLAGQMHLLGGAVNHRLNDRVTLTGSALFVRGRQTDAPCAPDANFTQGGCVNFAGLPLPYVPAQSFRFGVNWLAPQRWLLQAQAVYRTSRTVNDFAGATLRSGWDMAVKANWESADRQWLVEAFLLDMLKRDSSVTAGVQVVWRH